jgi:MFS family permease
VTRFRSLAALRSPSFRVYATAQGLASFGTWIQNITQDWLVLSLTHSGVAVGLTAAFQFLPALLLGPYGGVVADRWPRRRVLVLTQTVNCVVAVCTATVALTGRAQPWHIFALALVAGMVWVVDNPTRQALLGDMVGPDDLRSALAINSSIFQSARVVAPALAGVLITSRGSGFAFCVDTVFLAAGVLALTRLRPPARRPSALGALRETAGGTAEEADRGPVPEGGPDAALEAPAGAASAARPAATGVLRYLRGNPRIALTILLVGVVGTFGLNFPVVLTVIAQQDFHGTANLYGAFNICLAVGSIAGALVAAGRTGRARLRQIVILCAVFGAVQFAAALAEPRSAFLVLLVLLGFSNLTFQTVANSAVQLWTHPGLRGRVLGVYGQLFVGGTPIGAPLVGAMTTHWGGRIGMAFCGAAPLAAAVLLAGLVGWSHRASASASTAG